MKYLSVCSGIEAATVAWEPLGWEAVGFSEIEAFPRAVLQHHYPDVPLHGDFTQLIENPPSCDVLVGGTPCQAFSVAGSRRSLDDARGNLSLAYVMLADAIDRRNREEGKAPVIAVWENVPGVFSTSDNAFGFFLRGLAGSLPGEDGPLEPPGGKWTHCGAVLGPQRAIAWRVLDAQYFGLAQRRRRVFVVASARDGFDPTAVLLEWEGVRRDSAPSREARKEAPAPARSRVAGRDGVGCPEVSGPLGGAVAFEPRYYMRDKTGGAPSPTVTLTRDSKLGDSTPHVLAPAAPEPTAPALDPFVFDIMEPSPVLAVALRGREGGATAELSGEIQPALRTGGGGGDKPHVLTPAPVAFTTEQTPKFNDDCALTKQSPTGGGQIQSVMQSGMVVRRLTPRECERLQGFPDDFSRIPWKNKPAVDCPDGPRYKALGNSMAVPCMRWIGRRIAAHVAALEAEK